MNRLSIRLSLLLIVLVAPAAWAQQNEIPNASFEQWSNLGPLRWIGTNSPEDGFFNVTQSSVAHEGNSAARLEVKATPPPVVVPIPVALANCELQCQRDPDPLPEDRVFSISERYTAFSVWIRGGGGGGQIEITASVFSGLDVIGAGQVQYAPNPTSSDSDYVEVLVPITYINSARPNAAEINFSVLSPIGAVFFVDDLRFVLGGGGGGGGADDALVVVGDKDNLTAGDEVIQSTLEALSYTVVFENDDVVTDTSPAGHDVVVVAGSIESGAVDVNWASSAVPTVALDPDVFDDLGMTPPVAGTSTNTSSPVMALSIVSSSHPIANGASGMHDVFSQAHGMSFGSLGNGEGTVVARADGAKSVLFAYDDNDRLADGITVNTGRKVGFFMGEESATIANQNGMTLLRNAILWATLREAEISTSVTVEALDADVPDAFHLDQNYPNPFNPSTTIPFALKEAGHARLTVYNTLGQVVTTLVDERLPGGAYTADFEAGALPSGVYFYRLQVGGTLLSRAMLVQK